MATLPVALATREQVGDIGRVNGVTRKWIRCHKNAALVEESAAVSGSVQSQAQIWVEVVSLFNTGAGGISRR